MVTCPPIYGPNVAGTSQDDDCDKSIPKINNLNSTSPVMIRLRTDESYLKSTQLVYTYAFFVCAAKKWLETMFH